jgi:hypothetical protein
MLGWGVRGIWGFDNNLKEEEQLGKFGHYLKYVKWIDRMRLDLAIRIEDSSKTLEESHKLLRGSYLKLKTWFKNKESVNNQEKGDKGKQKKNSALSIFLHNNADYEERDLTNTALSVKYNHRFSQKLSLGGTFTFPFKNYQKKKTQFFNNNVDTKDVLLKTSQAGSQVYTDDYMDSSSFTDSIESKEKSLTIFSESDNEKWATNPKRERFADHNNSMISMNSVNKSKIYYKPISDIPSFSLFAKYRRKGVVEMEGKVNSERIFQGTICYKVNDWLGIRHAVYRNFGRGKRFKERLKFSVGVDVEF